MQKQFTTEADEAMIRMGAEIVFLRQLVDAQREETERQKAEIEAALKSREKEES